MTTETKDPSMAELQAYNAEKQQEANEWIDIFSDLDPASVVKDERESLDPFFCDLSNLSDRELMFAMLIAQFANLTIWHVTNAMAERAVKPDAVK
jgi:hypothetical protein